MESLEKMIGQLGNEIGQAATIIKDLYKELEEETDSRMRAMLEGRIDDWTVGWKVLLAQRGQLMENLQPAGAPFKG